MYKVHRPPTADELRVQFPMVKEVITALGVPIVEVDGWEGDDILGTLAVRGAAAGMRVLLVTGDKDALQLVNDNVQVVSTQEGHHRHLRLRHRCGHRALWHRTRTGRRLPRPQGRHVGQHPGRARAWGRRPPPSCCRSTARSTRCSSTPARSRASSARTSASTRKRAREPHCGDDPLRRAVRYRPRHRAVWRLRRAESARGSSPSSRSRRSRTACSRSRSGGPSASAAGRWRPRRGAAAPDGRVARARGRRRARVG